MPRTIVDVHILQNLPPSNVNRDDTGSPKTAVYGGIRRSRVSSQAWKRSTRLAFNATLEPEEVGTRTKFVVEELASRIRDRAPELSDRAQELAAATLTAAKFNVKAPKKGEVEEAGYLVFLSARQLSNLADLAIAVADEHDLKAALGVHDVKGLANSEHSIDIALFGRMLAEVPDINVDASAQVAHALGVHAVETEYDYFTAVDDAKKDDNAGAGMIGTVEFNSSTVYRYATVDVDRLNDTLGSPAASVLAVRKFLDAFITSMPTGKQNTFANRTLPSAVVVTIRKDQSINLVGAFEEAVVIADGASGGYMRPAAERLATYAADVVSGYGIEPVSSFVMRVGAATDALADMGERVTLGELDSKVGDLLAGRLVSA